MLGNRIVPVSVGNGEDIDYDVVRACENFTA